jgi:protein arginine kinase activator
MLCQACQQNPATVRVIDVTHPPQSTPAVSPSGKPQSKPQSKPQGKPSGALSSETAGEKASEPLGAALGAEAQLGDTEGAPTQASENHANATTHEQFLCESCAQTQHDVYGQAKDLAEVWKLLKAQQPSARKQAPGIACPDCGMTLRDFRQRGRLGCPKDYEVFGAQLRDLLERIHGAARHVGRGPNQDELTVVRRKRLDELQQALASAIRDEAYEVAAKLRDEIKSLEHS